ncbi:MAG: methyltransferase domain-containing protein [Candidatus Poribacteria bacterium]
MVDLRLSRERIVSRYDELARSEKFPDNTDLHRTFLKLINSELKPMPLNILDAGGGTGFFAVNLAMLNHQVTLLDLSSETLTVARKRSYEGKCSKHITNVEGDVEHLPFRAECFDVVVCAFVLAHLNNPDRAFKEFRRVLRKGGRLFISFENKLWHVVAAGLREKYGEAISLISSKSPVVKPYDLLPPIRIYSILEIEQLCQRHGFRISSFTGMRYLTSYQESLKGIGTTEAEQLLRDNPKAQKLERMLMESGELLCLARHIFVCCEVDQNLRIA